MTLTAFGGIKFRYQSKRRFALVHEHNGKVVIDGRSDSLDALRKRVKFFGQAIIDSTTNEQVAP